MKLFAILPVLLVGFSFPVLANEIDIERSLKHFEAVMNHNRAIVAGADRNNRTVLAHYGKKPVPPRKLMWARDERHIQSFKVGEFAFDVMVTTRPIGVKIIQTVTILTDASEEISKKVFEIFSGDGRKVSLSNGWKNEITIEYDGLYDLMPFYENFLSQIDNNFSTDSKLNGCFKLFH